MRSTFTEGKRTRQLSELELGRTEIQFSENNLVAYGSLNKEHIRSQAELTDFVLVEVEEVRLHGTSGISQKYITQISSEQTTNLNIKKKKITSTSGKKLTGKVKGKQESINIQIID